MNIVMTKTLQTQQKTFKETNPKYFFKVNIKTVKEYHMLSYFSGSELKVLLAIASFLNKYSKAYPSQKQISILTGLKVSTISRAIGKLATKEFLGEKVLVVIKGKAEGNRFTNNRYELSTKTGITFGDKDHSTESQGSIKHLDQTNENYTISENQLINQNNEVLSHKRNKASQSNRFIHNKNLLQYKEDMVFHGYAKLLVENDDYFLKDINRAEEKLAFLREKLGEEDWKDLMKNLYSHPRQLRLLQHMRFWICTKGKTYKEAWKLWEKKLIKL